MVIEEMLTLVRLPIQAQRESQMRTNQTSTHLGYMYAVNALSGTTSFWSIVRYVVGSRDPGAQKPGKCCRTDTLYGGIGTKVTYWVWENWSWAESRVLVWVTAQEYPVSEQSLRIIYFPVVTLSFWRQCPVGKLSIKKKGSQQLKRHYDRLKDETI